MVGVLIKNTSLSELTYEVTIQDNKMTKQEKVT